MLAVIFFPMIPGEYPRVGKKLAKLQGSQKRVSEFWLKDAMLLGSKAIFTARRFPEKNWQGVSENLVAR
jgi:hypothetical protein